MTYSSPREKALVEAVHEMLATRWGTSDHIRATYRVELYAAAYDDDKTDPGQATDESDFNRDLVLGR